MFIRFFITFLLSVFNLFIFGQQNSDYIALRISAVINSSKKIVTIPDHEVELSDNITKAIMLHKKVNIPFISITEYIKEYTKSAQGRAFIPKGALLLNIGNRAYGIWENEKGVMCSPETQTSFDDESWPNKLFNNLNKRKPRNPNSLSSVLKLLLLIDSNGYLKLENLKTHSNSNNI